MSDQLKLIHRTFGEGVVLEARHTGGTVSETLVVDFSGTVRQVLVASTVWADLSAAEDAFDTVASEHQPQPKRRYVRKADGDSLELAA